MTKHTVQLPDGLYERLTTLAKASGLSTDELIMAAIQQHLEDAEDLRAIAEYEQSVRDGTLKTYSLEEVERQLGLDP